MSTHPVYGFRYKNRNGKIKTGDTATAKSGAIFRVVSRLDVGQRNTNSLHTAGIVWIERTS